MFRLILCLLILGVSGRFAVAASTQKVTDLVESYYLNSPLLAEMPKPDQPHCSSQDPRGCIDAVCGRVNRFECDDRDELTEVAGACRNVRAECVNNICSRVNRFQCDTRNEVVQVATACRGVVHTSCIDYVCSKLSHFDCDEVSELTEIARRCR